MSGEYAGGDSTFAGHGSLPAAVDVERAPVAPSTDPAGTDDTPAGSTLAATGEVVDIAIDMIGVDQGVRRERLDLDHIQRLREVLDVLPPVLLRRKAERIELVDGAHRVAAHSQSGCSTIRAVVLQVDDAEAVLAATEANISHGRPLDMADRQNAAKRVMALAPDLSDAMIGKRCGLSDKSVAALRSTSESPRLNTRTGRDGKRRPASAEVARERRSKAEEIAEAEPDISTRDLSAKSGVSLGTAASVKKGGHLRDVSATTEEKVTKTVADAVVVIPNWMKTPQAKRSNEGRDFCQFMAARGIKGDDLAAVAASYAEKCPAELLDAAIATAHLNAAAWTRLAEVAASRKHRMEVVK